MLRYLAGRVWQVNCACRPVKKLLKKAERFITVTVVTIVTSTETWIAEIFCNRIFKYQLNIK